MVACCAAGRDDVGGACGKDMRGGWIDEGIASAFEVGVCSRMLCLGCSFLPSQARPTMSNAAVAVGRSHPAYVQINNRRTVFPGINELQ
jgi:hypothetical protein